MKEQIILTRNIKNAEILRSLAKFGVNTLGVKFMNASQLAKHALMHAGVSVCETYLSPSEEPALFYTCLQENTYFSTSSYADAENFSSVLSSLRMLIIEDEENTLSKKLLEGEFMDKNEAFLSVYKSYLQFCRENNLIDSIGLIRKAIQDASGFDAEFIMLSDCPLQPLEEALLAHVSGGHYKTLTLSELFHVKKTSLHVDSYKNCYGAVNEVFDILSTIYQKNLPLDQCTIACANPSTYGQILFDVSQQYQIPITYGSGIPIGNSNPAKLLKLLLYWDGFGQHGIDAWKNLLFSDAFYQKSLLSYLDIEDSHTIKALDMIAETAGNLRLSFNLETNQRRIEAYRTALQHSGDISKTEETADFNLFPSLEKLSHLLSGGYADFIKRFSVIRSEPLGRIDQAALEVITAFIETYLRYAPADTLPNVIPSLLEKTVLSETSRSGCLHIASISGAACAMRKNLFVCGLSASEFPGSPTENYLLLDSDYLLFANKANAPTSKYLVTRKKDDFFSLIQLASDLKVSISLSYAGYDLAQLKEENPSSVLFACYEAAHPERSMDDFRQKLKNVPYFSDNIRTSGQIGIAYANKKHLSTASQCACLPKQEGLIEKAWSPSALDLFFQCPRHFYLRYIAHLPETEPDDPAVVIHPSEVGTIAHAMMQKLADIKMSETEFLDLCGQSFDDFLCRRPPLHLHDAQNERNEFLRMMKNAYLQDPGNEILSAENEYKFLHPSGICLHGYPDRVEKNTDGAYLIADYKTKQKVEHNPNDINDCLQVVIYAWLCEQAGIPISYGEYRYIRKNKTITCMYDDFMKKRLDEKLLEFRYALDKNIFPRNPGDANVNCKYCSFQGICEWDSITENEDSEVSL